MKTLESDKLVYILIGVIVALVFAVARLFVNFNSLQESQENGFHEVELEVQRLYQKLEFLQNQTNRLPRAEPPSPSLDIPKPETEHRAPGQPVSPAVVKHQDIPSGLFILSTTTQFRKESSAQASERRVKIYHIKTGIAGLDTPRKLNIGIATSGLTTAPLFYIDYDEDNAVDMRIMREFVWNIPFGRLMADSIDQFNAQELYNSFLENHQKSSHTNIEEIKKSGGEIAIALWNFIEQQSEQIVKSINSATKQATAKESYQLSD